VKKYDRDNQATDGNVIRRMHFTRRITKTRDTHSKYVIFLLFHDNKLIGERASMSRYTYWYIAFFVCVTTRVTVTEEVLKLLGVQL
jgi:hypothetical protein